MGLCVLESWACASACSNPGEHDAITDVPGVLVGHTTLIAGDGPLVVGAGARADRGHGRHPARGRRLDRARVRGLPPAQRQRRADRASSGSASRGCSAASSGSPTPTRSASCATRSSPTRRGPTRGDARVLVAAGRGRDVRRRAQRHQRLPRDGRARRRGASRPRAGGPVEQGNVGGGVGMILPRVQGRDRDGLAAGPGRGRRLDRRRARPGELRRPGAAAGRRRPGGRGDPADRGAEPVGPEEAAVDRHATDARPAMARRGSGPAAARSSWSSRRTRRCSPTSASGWPSGRRSGSARMGSYRVERLGRPVHRLRDRQPRAVADRPASATRARSSRRGWSWTGRSPRCSRRRSRRSRRRW